MASRSSGIVTGAHRCGDRYGSSPGPDSHPEESALRRERDRSGHLRWHRLAADQCCIHRQLYSGAKSNKSRSAGRVAARVAATRSSEMFLVVKGKEQRLMMSLRASAWGQTFQINVGITSRFINNI